MCAAQTVAQKHTAQKLSALTLRLMDTHVLFISYSFARFIKFFQDKNWDKENANDFSVRKSNRNKNNFTIINQWMVILGLETKLRDE